MNTPGLIEHQAVTTIVENVTQVREEVAQAFLLLQQAKARFIAVCGDGPATHYGHLWDASISDYDLSTRATEVDQNIERNAWRYVLNQTGVMHYMTEQRKKELEEQFRTKALPTLTAANVLSTVQGLTSHIGTLLQESVQEVFDWLCPRFQGGVGALKTNSAFRVGQKVIVSYAVEADWGRTWHGFRLNHHRDSHFRALGNVLSLLDGQGVQRYPDDLVTQLTMGLRTAQAGAVIETPYLACKPYKNGRMHLLFRRGDLVDKLNQLGGDGVGLAR